MTAYSIVIGVLFVLWLLPALAVIGLYLGELLRDRLACSSSLLQQEQHAPEAAAPHRVARPAVYQYATAHHGGDAVSAHTVPDTDRRFPMDTVRRVESGNQTRERVDLQWELYLN